MTQLSSPSGSEASIFSSEREESSESRSSRVCKYGGSCERLMVRFGS